MSRTSGLIVSQARLEQRAFWRNPDYAFFTFVLPIGLLLLLGAIEADSHIPDRGIRAVTLFVPGILTFGVIAAAYANLAARIAVLRSDGVLKRIRATPLEPGAYLGGHLTSTLATSLLVAAATIALGHLVFDTAPRLDRAPTLILGLCLGILCFAALALAISIVIPSAEAAGPITNASYLPLALVSGVFDPTLDLPSWLTRAVEAFPIKALVDTLQAAYDPTTPTATGDLLVLAVWSAIGVLVARRYFRWEP